MEEGLQKWGFRGNEDLCAAPAMRALLRGLFSSVNPDDNRRVISICHGDPSASPCFRTASVAEDAVVDALRSASFNGYSDALGILPARKAIAEHLSGGLPYELSADDVFVTVGCNHAIEVALTVLARPRANILFPRPGFPHYESRAAISKLDVRHFDLLPEQGWEVDLDSVEALADEHTVAMVIINPGNPSGSVYTSDHLQKIAETARELGVLVIADEVYDHLVFGSVPFVPMGTFGSIAPVLTLGSISKLWIVPGWRLGWLAITDPGGILREYGVTESIKGFLNNSPDPTTFVQGAVPRLLEKTKDDFSTRILDILRKNVDNFWEKLKDIRCIHCPHKPQGGMFAMVKLDPSLLEGIIDDTDFCCKLAKEESVLVLPGAVMGMKNWLRIAFAIEPALLEEALERMTEFYQRHAIKQ